MGLQIPFVFCPIIVAILTIRQLTLKPRLRIAGILLTVLIPTIGLADYDDKTVTQTTFTEVHGLDKNSKDYMGRYSATPTSECESEEIYSVLAHETRIR